MFIGIIKVDIIKFLKYLSLFSKKPTFLQVEGNNNINNYLILSLFYNDIDPTLDLVILSIKNIQ